MFVITQDALAIDVLMNFAEMMRQNDIEAIRRLFTRKDDPNVHGVFTNIIDFIEGYSDLILEDLQILDGTASGKWVLDLTVSSLSSLLRYWNERIPEMTVFCDESKPLEDSRPYFDAMVGRVDRPMLKFPNGKEFCPLFNLKEPIQFVSSVTSYGIQIADIIAGTASFALKTKDAEFLEMVDAAKTEECVFPTLQNIDLRQKAPFLNGVVLKELSERALGGYEPLDGMREFYAFIEERYDVDPPPS